VIEGCARAHDGPLAAQRVGELDLVVAHERRVDDGDLGLTLKFKLNTSN